MSHETRPFTIFDRYEVEDFRRGAPSRLPVWVITDDDDYSEPTRRMFVTASSEEAAELMWDDPFTEDNVYARRVFLKGRHLRLPGTSRVLSASWLIPMPLSPSQAA
jgi:hypothetical protein